MPPTSAPAPGNVAFVGLVLSSGELHPMVRSATNRSIRPGLVAGLVGIAVLASGCKGDARPDWTEVVQSTVITSNSPRYETNIIDFVEGSTRRTTGLRPSSPAGRSMTRSPVGPCVNGRNEPPPPSARSGGPT